MPPVAYLRKSVVHDAKRSVSWQVQEGAVRALAAVHGDDKDLVILSDWNVSGRKGRAQRPDYDRLLSMIDSGQVSAIYSYSLSRLSRSLTDFLSLVDRCVAANVPLRLHVERHLDPTTSTGRLIIRILASVAAMESEVATERSRDAIEARRRRGDRIGGIRYGKKLGEDLDAVIDTFRETGGYRATAVALNERGVKSRSGKPWMAPTIRNILLRVAPELVPARTHRGAMAAPAYRLAHLLRCPYDGRLLTAQTGSEGTPRYACTHAYSVAGHGPRYVAESKLLPWVKAEASRVRTPERIEMVEDQDRQRLDLDARRARVVDALEAGLITRAEAEPRLAKIAAEIATLDLQRRIADVPALDWERWAPRDVNAALRSMWSEVQLGPDLLPVRAEWTVPEWRS